MSLFNVGITCVLALMTLLSVILVAVAIGVSPHGWLGVAIPLAIAAIIFAFVTATIAHMMGRLPLIGDDD